MICLICGEELCEKNYLNHFLKKHPNESASDIRSAASKRYLLMQNLILNEVERDLNENIPPTCIILSVSE